MPPLPAISNWGFFASIIESSIYKEAEPRGGRGAGGVGWLLHSVPVLASSPAHGPPHLLREK